MGAIVAAVDVTGNLLDAAIALVVDESSHLKYKVAAEGVAHIHW